MSKVSLPSHVQSLALISQHLSAAACHVCSSSQIHSHGFHVVLFFILPLRICDYLSQITYLHRRLRFASASSSTVEVHMLPLQCVLHSLFDLCLSRIALAWRWWIPKVNLSAGSCCLHHAMSSMDLLGLRFLSHGELCSLSYSSDLLMCIATVCVHRQDVWGAISHMPACLDYMRGRHWVFILVAHILFWVLFRWWNFDDPIIMGRLLL